MSDDEDTISSSPRQRRRRRPAPRSHPFWRFVFPVLVVAAGAAVFFVWRAGTKAVLDSTDGEQIEVITDPTQPGFVAFVEPTPTMLIAHTDDQGTLVGITVLARTALDEGGTAVLVSADLLVEPSEDPADAVVLHALYEEEGLDGLALVVGDLFGFGFRESGEITTDGLRGVLRLVEPIPFNLSDDLMEVTDSGEQSVVFGAGALQLSGEEAARLYAWRNATEFDANRTQRQLQLWRRWLSEIDGAEDPIAVTTPFEDGLPPYLRSLGTGTADLSVLAVRAVPFDENAAPIYVLDEAGLAALHDKATEMVPLPIASHPGARPTVRLLDGTGNAELRDRTLPVLVEAGAEITIIGNAASFGVTDTVVAYHVMEQQEAAGVLAEAIGATVTFVEDPEQPTDLTVIVGSDQESQ